MKAVSRVSEVSERLGDDVPAVVRDAIGALGSMGAEGQALSADVAKHMRSSNVEVRVAAVRFFAKRSVAALAHSNLICKALSDEAGSVREAAVSVFQVLKGKAEPMRAAAAMVLTNGGEPRFKAAAAVALGHVGPTADAHSPAIVELLGDVSEDLSDAARVASGAQKRCPAELRIPACAGITALALLDAKKYGQQIASLLDSEEVEVQLCALKALASSSANFEEQITPFLESTSERVRAAAASALGKLASAHGPSEDAAEKVGELLADASSLVRNAAVEAIGLMGDEGAAYSETILELFNDKSLEVRASAVEAMAGIGLKGQMYAALVARLIHRDAQNAATVRCAALDALARMGERGHAFANEVAEELQDADAGIRAKAIETLAKMGEEAAPFRGLIESARNDQFEVVRSAAAAALTGGMLEE